MDELQSRDGTQHRIDALIARTSEIDQRLADLRSKGGELLSRTIRATMESAKHAEQAANIARIAAERGQRQHVDSHLRAAEIHDQAARLEQAAAADGIGDVHAHRAEAARHRAEAARHRREADPYHDQGTTSEPH